MKCARKPARKKRAYRMGARAESAEQTRERILQAAYELFLALPYDEVTLAQIAERASVTKQTILRQFTSKDRLAFALVDWQRPREEAARDVQPGDVKGAVQKVVDRYEAMGDANVRVLEIERRVPAIGYLLAQGRESHRQWIERIFSPFLPDRKSGSYRRRVMAFYAATEVTVWKLLRRDFELSRADTEAVLFDLVTGLVAESKRDRR